MKTDEIKKLLDAFYDGNSTEKEIHFLRSYFESKDVSEELLDEKELFLQFSKANEVEIPANLEDKLDKLIDQLSAQEKTEKQNTNRPKSRLWLWVVSTAACIALLVSLSIGFSYNDEQGAPIVQTEGGIILKDSFTDPVQAQKQAEMALQLVASKMNKGMAHLTSVSDNIEKTNEQLDKIIKKQH